MQPISILANLQDGLDALCRLDQRLEAVRAAVAEVPLRRAEPGFASLVSIVVGQQVSTASAAAIFARFAALIDPLTPRAVLAADDAVFRAAGFSGAKVRTVRALAQAVHDGLDLDHICGLDAEHAVGLLTKVPGIGPWTAESYLLFAAGHPDVFPAGDVALQAAVAHAFGLARRPGDKALRLIAAQWSPWRAIAARLFWSYYRVMRAREGVFVAGPASAN
ncbi:MAG: DNA-3-methyladenine glycosylase 2 family protein [Methylobacterium mesophilicum]|nr:DNA-3-methyladenine glycosylase 2 family protein [Methylobacterium mesophilicum]